jgi:hypothetical protein
MSSCTSLPKYNLCRIVHDDGGDVHVNAVEPVEHGVVNVINGLGNVTLIYVGVVMLMIFLIRLILPRNGMGRCMRGDVRMFVFNVVRLNGLLWDAVRLPDGDYSQAKKSRRGRSWGLFPGFGSDCRNTRVKSSAMRKAKDEDYCTTRKECHSCLLSIKVLLLRSWLMVR